MISYHKRKGWCAVSWYPWSYAVGPCLTNSVTMVHENKWAYLDGECCNNFVDWVIEFIHSFLFMLLHYFAVYLLATNQRARILQSIFSGNWNGSICEIPHCVWAHANWRYGDCKSLVFFFTPENSSQQRDKLMVQPNIEDMNHHLKANGTLVLKVNVTPLLYPPQGHQKKEPQFWRTIWFQGKYIHSKSPIHGIVS